MQKSINNLSARKDRFGLSPKDILYCLIFSGVSAVFLEIYATLVTCNFESYLGQSVTVLLKSLPQLVYVRRMIVFFIAIAVVSLLVKMQRRPPAEFLYKYRFVLFGILLFALVAFEISGSSLGIWANYLSLGSKTDSNTLLGEFRSIRSDEWALNTPMAVSQEYSGFHYFSDVIRGCSTDTFVVYGQPVWNIAEIFRPFHWGYLILGSAKGLSFFWYGRLFALFLVTLQLMMLITGNNKRLSFIGAMMITFAPIVQWWFAINGIIEMFVFGQLAVLMLDRYMKDKRFGLRCLYLAIMVICAGGYVLTFYPSWMVPMAYVFLGLAIWVFIKNFKSTEFHIKDTFSVIAALVVFVALMIYIFTKSADTIKSVMGTVYPGERFDLGGEADKKFFYYPFNLFFALRPEGMPCSVCESAVFFDLFPLPVILSVMAMIRNKKKDILSIILLIVFVFLTLWCVVGFPPVLAKLTLLSNSQSERSILAVGFVSVLILIRALIINEKLLPVIPTAIISVVFGGGMVFICKKYMMSDYVGMIYTLLVAAVLIACFWFALRYNKKVCRVGLTIIMSAIMIVCGGLVNPVEKGIGAFDDHPVLEDIEQINSNDSGLWVVEGLNYPYNNLPLLRGLPTINSTNVYPTLERWRLIDPDGEFEEVYNRYAHITVIMGNNDPKFVLRGADYFQLNAKVEDLATLNVKYILTINDLSVYSNQNVTLTEQTLSPDIIGFRVYKLSYTN